MWNRMIVMLILVGLVFGGLFGYKAFGRYMMQQYFATSKQPPVAVATSKVSFQLWQERLRAVGTVRAARGIDLACETAGTVSEVYFKSGQQAVIGQLLAQLDTSSEVAQLRVLQAAVEQIKTAYERDLKLLEIQAVSQAVVDNDAAELKARRAQVTQQMTLITKKYIRAPFSGQLGISKLSRGQYVNPGEKIVTLQALDPVFIDLNLPQQDLGKIHLGQKVDIKTDAYPDKVFIGQISAVSPVVDPGSRNVQVEARVSNVRKELLPGMFTSIEIEVGAPRKALTLPQSAVAFNPYGETVFTVESKKDTDGKEELTARQVLVTVAGTRGDQAEVVSGLKEGDEVVVSGQHKLKNGSPVVLNNKVVPLNEANPRPVDQ